MALSQAKDDVARMFQHLVAVLAERHPELLQEPIELPDLYEKIIPYRGHRVALRFDTNEDYEMALLRMLAGEHGYIEIEPAEVRDALAQEANSPNPNPGAFRAYPGARARLNFRAVKEVLEARPAYAPPLRADGPAVLPGREGGQPGRQRQQMPFEFDPDTPLNAPTHCPQCRGTLPAGRAVTFCPHCGGNVNVRDCPQCGTQLELDWRHCVTCGYRVQ